LQRKLNERAVVQRKPNRTGLPDQLKHGVEALSGMSLDAVRVHRNSAEPARVQALATAKGSEIHLGPGQERHLAHEAWHTVQQMQGRVRPTMQLKTGVMVNDDAGLEREADAMGARALQVGASGSTALQAVTATGTGGSRAEAQDSSATRVVQSVGAEVQGQPVVQRFTYRGVGNESQVTVAANGARLDLTGAIHPAGGGEAQPVSGGVSLTQVQVPEDKLREEGNPQTMVRCLRVFGLQANPQGQRLGPLLTYEHGLHAQALGCAYVVAQDVSGAGGPFYLPLGFQDFLGGPKWRTLTEQRNGLQAMLARADLPPSPDGTDPMLLVGNELVAVMNLLSQAAMFIPTGELIANSQAAFAARWVQAAPAAAPVASSSEGSSSSGVASTFGAASAATPSDEKKSSK
jgi:hypothetical protein